MKNNAAPNHSAINLQKFMFATIMFIAAYMTTITVNAQTSYDGRAPVTTMTTGDAMQFGKNSNATITGTIVEADGNEITIKSAGREIRVVLTEMELRADAEEVFKTGMQVSVTGEMGGETFGVPVMIAKNITASENGLVTVVP